MKRKWRKCKNQLTKTEELKNKHTETNNTITEIKNTLEGINSRISETKPRTNLTLYEAHTNHWTTLRRAETKKKKQFIFEAPEKETSNTISFLKIMKMQRNTT